MQYAECFAWQNPPKNVFDFDFLLLECLYIIDFQLPTHFFNFWIRIKCNSLVVNQDIFLFKSYLIKFLMHNKKNIQKAIEYLV